MNAINRVAVNTAILYGRMILTVGITLYSTRLVLNALGTVDYGIFNLIAGIILMLSFLNGAMATSTQRYLSFYQGKKDVIMQKKVFLNSLFIHILIGLVVVLGLEIGGYFLLNGFLKIPTARLNAAHYIYHFMSGTVFFTVLTVPFNGSLIAHENMLWVAIVNIIETLLKLVIALLLFSVSSDKLITYGVLTALVSVVSFFLYSIYCFNKYQECEFPDFSKVDSHLALELTSYAGWNLFGALCGVGKTQGLAILLNIFFGTVVNAAYGISNQVSSQLSFFSVTMLRAIDPQIMKSEGDNDRYKMIKLSMIASKFGFLLLALVAIPCIFEMNTILKVWLKIVPEYAVPFCSLILVAFMTNQLTIGLDSAAQATGKIKAYMLGVGTVKLLILPLGYLLLKLNFDIYYVFYSYIFLEALGGIVRMFILRRLVALSIIQYSKTVFMRLLVPVLLTILVNYLVTVFIFSPIRAILTLFISSITMIVSVYFLGLVKYEKLIIDKILSQIQLRIR